MQAHGTAAKTRVGQRLGVSGWRAVVLAGDDVFARLGKLREVFAHVTLV